MSIACSSVHFLSRKQTMKVQNCSRHDQVSNFVNKMATGWCMVRCKIVVDMTRSSLFVKMATGWWLAHAC